MAHVVGG